MKLAEIQHGTEFLSRTTLLHFLGSIIRYMFESIVIYCNIYIYILFNLVFTKYSHGSSTSTEAIFRSRAMMISGRLLSKENIYMFVDESSKTSSVSDVTDFCFPTTRYVKRHGITTISFFILNIRYTAAWLLWIATLIYDICTLCVAFWKNIKGNWAFHLQWRPYESCLWVFQLNFMCCHNWKW